jgi:uncharacterized protein
MEQIQKDGENMFKTIRSSLVLLFLFTALCLATDDRNTLSSYGEGSYEARPDVVYVSLGVQRDGYTAREAQEALRKDIAKLIEALQAQGLTEETIKTDSYSLYPVYRTKKISDTESEEEISKYRAYVRLTCEIYKIGDAGKLVDAAISAGANRVESMDFAVKDQAAAKQEALLRAMAAAKSKAQLIAGQFGVILVKPMSISESTFFDSPSPRMYAMKADMGGNESMNLPAGTLKVKTRVDVVYETALDTKPVTVPPVVVPTANQ